MLALGFFFELSLSSILFSAHEIDARLWAKNRKDSNWRAIESLETGIFSKHFVGAFFEEMKEYSEEYHALATKLYRECSEFVHGNRQSFNGIDGQIEYRPEVIDAWTDRADTARLVVKFVFLSRYLKDASVGVRNGLEHLALDNFGSLPPIQSLFQSVPK